MNEGARRDGGRGRAGDRWKGKEWCCWEVVVRGRSSSMGAVLLSPPQIPAGLKGFLGIPEDS